MKYLPFVVAGLATRASRLGIVFLLLVIGLGAAFIPGCADPNDNPLRDVAATCQPDSQNHRFFGPAFTYDNDTGRAQLARSFKALAENSEPTLACGAEPDEAYRLTIVGQWPNVPLIISAQRVDERATLRAAFPRHDPTAGTWVLDRLERPLSGVEWSSLSERAGAINLMRMRAILVSEDERDYGRQRLIEFRREGNYGLMKRPSVRTGDALDSLTAKLIELAGIDYPWF
jgi:hypothetical protein